MMDFMLVRVWDLAKEMRCHKTSQREARERNMGRKFSFDALAANTIC
jgi:hypothetical protein